jgi:hypothetical protein
MKLPMLSEQDKAAEIRRLYYATTRETIHQDLERALDLLKSMPGEAERERVAVYMDGLAQMRGDWNTRRSKKSEVRRKKKSK